MERRATMSYWLMFVINPLVLLFFFQNCSMVPPGVVQAEEFRMPSSSESAIYEHECKFVHKECHF